MVVVYEGEDGTVGSRSRWEGKKVVKGEQQVVSIEGNTVETELTFYMPWGPSKSTGYIHAADTQGGSEVTWGMRGENNFIFRIFAVFMNMEKEAGPMFEEGLQSLKAMVENDQAMANQGSTMQVTTVEFPGHKYIAAKAKISMTELPNFFAQNYARIIDALTKANQQMTGALFFPIENW
jgi:hypothetical protein